MIRILFQERKFLPKKIYTAQITELYFGPNFLDLYAGSRFKHIRVSSSVQDRDDTIVRLISMIPNKNDIRVGGDKKAIKKFWEDGAT